MEASTPNVPVVWIRQPGEPADRAPELEFAKTDESSWAFYEWDYVEGRKPIKEVLGICAMALMAAGLFATTQIPSQWSSSHPDAVVASAVMPAAPQPAAEPAQPDRLASLTEPAVPPQTVPGDGRKDASAAPLPRRRPAASVRLGAPEKPLGAIVVRAAPDVRPQPTGGHAAEPDYAETARLTPPAVMAAEADKPQDVLQPLHDGVRAAVDFGNKVISSNVRIVSDATDAIVGLAK